MASKKNQPKKVAGVALEPAVLEYLDELAEREDRSRSWILNKIARDHAERNGVSLAAFSNQAHQLKA